MRANERKSSAPEITVIKTISSEGVETVANIMALLESGAAMTVFKVNE